MKRPLIGIPTAEIPTAPNEPPMWAMRTSYAQPIIDAGGMPILLPPVQSLDGLVPLLGQLDGLLLAGGADVDPSLYKARPQPELEVTDPIRDQSEALLTSWALEQTIPILGICRGMQIVNVVTGGTLHQDLVSTIGDTIPHRTNPASYAGLASHGHPMTVKVGSRIHGLTGTDEVWVSSMHHQGIDQLGRGLLVTAATPDGVIEAIESDDPNHWLVALQGHPEAMVAHTPWARALFEEFVAAAENRLV